MELEGELYVEQPDDFSSTWQENKVCKLMKSFYGLRQALKQCHEKFDNVIIECIFKINKYNKCIYVKDAYKSNVISCL